MYNIVKPFDETFYIHSKFYIYVPAGPLLLLLSYTEYPRHFYLSTYMQTFYLTFIALLYILYFCNSIHCFPQLQPVNL